MKQIGQIWKSLGVLLLLLAPLALRAGTSERVVSDRFSGLAIYGYDPVAYFTDGGPWDGRQDFELNDGGAIWRFRNEGNRAAFAAHPEIYAPQFGGYDPIDVARGVARAGQPRIWLVIEQRLYLFGDADSRNAFAASPAEVRKAAQDAWPVIEKLLAR